MAVKFTTLIKMDMNRNADREEFLTGKLGWYEEDISIWEYHLEIPCKADEKENEIFVQALSQKFSEEEADYKVSVENGKNYFSVTASGSDSYEDIEDLYDVAYLYVEYLEEILEEYGIEECILTLELYSDMALYPYDEY